LVPNLHLNTDDDLIAIQHNKLDRSFLIGND